MKKYIVLNLLIIKKQDLVLLNIFIFLDLIIILGNKTAYEHRKMLGEELAKENKDDINLDIVVQ